MGIPSSKRRAATRATRARQAEAKEKYNGARQATRPEPVATAPAGHPFKRGHWMPERCAEGRCNLERDAPVHQIGGFTPPEDWLTWAYGRPMLSTTHDGTTRTVAVLDGQGVTVLASITVPWRPADELLAEYEAAGLGTASNRREIELGRPDLLAHELGYQSFAGWRLWPDGSWRSSTGPLDRRHVATLRPVAPGSPDLQVLTVREVPGGRIVVDEMVDPIDPGDTGHGDERLNAVLDQHGYTVARWGWTKLPGGVRYGLALPGRRAERSWWIRAKVRILADHGAGCPDLHTPDHTYRAGEEVTMIQYGSAREEIDRDTWWSSTDIDAAYAVPATSVEIVEVLENVEPFWADAELTAEQVIAALAPYHPQAQVAVPLWFAAGLVVAENLNGFGIYTPAPERRLIGLVPRDYWDKNRPSKPYEVVIDPEKTVWNYRLGVLPHFPLDEFLGEDH